MAITGKLYLTEVLEFLSVLFFSVVPYCFTIHGNFVFDDSLAIVNNKDISSDSWLQPFYNDFWGTNIKSNSSHKSYRPLTILSFKLNYILDGREFIATHFKITNVVLHMLCCIILWKVNTQILDDLYINIGRAKKIGYQATLLFSVHPVHVESVSGIVGRADLLSAVVFLVAFLTYKKAATCANSSSLVFIVLTAILSAVSMLFKENGITILGFCIIYDLIVGSFKFKHKSNKYSFVRITALMISAAIILYIRWTVMGRMKPQFKSTDNPAHFSNDFFTKLASYNYIYFINLLLFVWPKWLCFDWSMGCIPLIRNMFDHRLIFIILMYIYGLLILKTICDKNVKSWKKRFLVVSTCLIILPFLPAANIFFPVGFVIAERILYLPSAGYCLLAIYGLHNIKIPVFSKKVKSTIFWFLIIIYSLRTWQRSGDWQDEYKLFLSGLDVCPLNAKVRYNVAKVVEARNQTDRAIAEYEEAIRLHPEYSEAMNNLGNIFKDRKNLEQAEFYLRKSIQYKPKMAPTWMNLGIVLAKTGRYDEAEKAYKQALEYRSNYAMCYFNMGNLYLDRKMINDAVDSWMQAIKINSTHVLAWTNLLALLDNSDQLNKAMEIIPKALRWLPNAPTVHFAVANIFGKLEKYQEAEYHFKKSLQLFGEKVSPIHYTNLGVLYHRWKKYDLAEKMYKNALRLQPTFDSARKNLLSLNKIK